MDQYTGQPAGSALRWRVAAGLVALGILLAAAWLALIVVSRIDELFFPGQDLGARLPPVPGVQQGPSDEQLNILVMGLDRRPSEGELPTRTDTMFVLTIETKTKTAGILGIPRDLWVEIPFPDDGYYEERINTAYATGERGLQLSSGETASYGGGGARLVRDVIEHNLGIEIDHHVIIDFEGFIELIDALDGIDIYVEEEINDPLYSRTELPGDYHPLHFDIGEQHMDGQTALDYARTRYDSSDLDRIRRQQQVIFAAIDKALERRLVSVDTMLGLWEEYKDTIDTDINDLRGPGYATLAAQIDPDRIVALSLGAATTPWTGPQGQQVLLVDKTIVQELVDALFGRGEGLPGEGALVEVQNGAGAEGLATLVVTYLTEFGFPSGSLSPADTVDGELYSTTAIIDFTGNAETVDRLSELLGVTDAQVRRATADDESLLTVPDADVLIILGSDAQARDYSIGGEEG